MSLFSKITHAVKSAASWEGGGLKKLVTHPAANFEAGLRSEGDFLGSVPSTVSGAVGGAVGGAVSWEVNGLKKGVTENPLTAAKEGVTQMANGADALTTPLTNFFGWTPLGASALRVLNLGRDAAIDPSRLG